MHIHSPFTGGFKSDKNKNKKSNVKTCYAYTVVSRKYAPPFATLALVQSAGGAYTRDATFSLAITPSLPVPRPQLRVQIEEDNAFDDFAVAIWKDVIYICASAM